MPVHVAPLCEEHVTKGTQVYFCAFAGAVSQQSCLIVEGMSKKRADAFGPVLWKLRPERKLTQGQLNEMVVGLIQGFKRSTLIYSAG